MLFAFKTYCKAIIIKIILSWCEDKHIDQYNVIESPEINEIYGQLTFNRYHSYLIGEGKS